MMNVTIICGEYEYYYIQDVIKAPEMVAQTILWSEHSGPESLAGEALQKLMSCQYIIVAMKDRAISAGMMNLLTRILPDGRDRLLDFFAMYEYNLPTMVVDRRMQYPPVESYEGMILGISHAEVGILSRCFEKPFCNLAISCQDIYYQLKTFEYCMEKYPDKIRDLKYVILELFDYTYFNYDVSLSSRAQYYYSIGGYRLDGHNYERNKLVDWPFEIGIEYIDVQRSQGIDAEKIKAWKELFPDIYKYDNYNAFANYANIDKRVRTVIDKDVEEYVVETSIVRNLYENTVNENVLSFCMLLDKIYRFNPNMQVFVLLMPRYSRAQEKSENAYARWKEVFYGIIEETKKQYPFHLLDLKGHPISEDASLYYDISHFNYYGAYQFTEVLKKYIFAES